MPRNQPRRSNTGSVGSYTSFFTAEGTSSVSSPSSSSSSASSASFEEEGPPPAPTHPSSSPPPPPPREGLGPISAALEARLESLFTRTESHSLKDVDKKERKRIEDDLERTRADTTMRKWWVKRQWAEKKQTVSGSQSLSTSKATATSGKKVGSKPGVVVKKKKVAQKPTTTTAPDIDVAAPPASIHHLPETPTINHVRAGPSRPVVYQTAPLPMPTIQPSSVAPLLLPPALPQSTFVAPLFDPITLPLPVPSLFDSTATSNLQDLESATIPTGQQIALPATIFSIATWTRRSIVDPKQLPVVYDSLSDSFVFSTQHLESVYCLHLPVACITALYLFHSLAHGRSVLLFQHDLFHPSIQPTFSVSSTSDPVPRPISDFTPDGVASTIPIYALELDGTSLIIPLLLDKIDPLSIASRSLAHANSSYHDHSTSESIDSIHSKLFVGPWDPNVLKVENIVESVMKSRRSSIDNARGGFGEENEEVWVRKVRWNGS